MQGFDPLQSFGPDVAARYDEDARGDEPETVGFLAELAGDGPVLEFAIGTGRIALPLAEQGLRVDGIEQSGAMVDVLRAKPGGAELAVTVGDMSTVALPDRYSLVYLIFNTIHNLLTQDGQVRCFENAARHLSDDGVFVLETGVPWDRPRTGSYLDVIKLELDEVRLSAYRVRRDDPDPRHQPHAADDQRHSDVTNLPAPRLSGRARPHGPYRRSAAAPSVGWLAAGAVHR